MHDKRSFKVTIAEEPVLVPFYSHETYPRCDMIRSVRDLNGHIHTYCRLRLFVSLAPFGHSLIPPKNWEIALWPSTNRSIPYILVLAGSESIFIEMTEHSLISLLQVRPELHDEKSVKYRTNTSYYCTRLAFLAFVKRTLYFTTRVFDNSAIFSFLVGWTVLHFLWQCRTLIIIPRVEMNLIPIFLELILPALQLIDISFPIPNISWSNPWKGRSW